MQIIQDQLDRNGIASVCQIMKSGNLWQCLEKEALEFPSALMACSYTSLVAGIAQVLDRQMPFLEKVPLTLVGNDLGLVELLAQRGVEKLTVLCPDIPAYENMTVIKSNVPSEVEVDFVSVTCPKVEVRENTFVLVGFSRSTSYSLLTKSQSQMVDMLTGYHPALDLVMIDPLSGHAGFIQDSPSGWVPISNQRFKKIITTSETIITN